MQKFGTWGARVTATGLAATTRRTGWNTGVCFPGDQLWLVAGRTRPLAVLRAAAVVDSYAAIAALGSRAPTDGSIVVCRRSPLAIKNGQILGTARRLQLFNVGPQSRRC